WSLIAAGQDPGNRRLSYQVYQRSYSNALVLYKPLSYAGGVTGTTADNTATFLRLNGVYRVLQANGSLGPPVTSVSLRHGQGAVIVRACPFPRISLRPLGRGGPGLRLGSPVPSDGPPLVPLPF